MSTQVNPLHNLNALLIGTGEFSFSENAVSPADAQNRGWLDIGNIAAFTPNVKLTKQLHVGSYRGVRRVDRQAVTETQTLYKIKCDEWNLELLRVLFGTTDTTGFTQGALTAANGAPLTFGTTAAVIGKWYDIMTAAANYLLTGATVYAGGTGYVVGDVLGITGGTSSVAAVLTVTAVANNGAILAVAITNAGNYSVQPTLTNNAATGGTGTSATLNLGFANITANQLRNLTTVTFSGKVEGTDFVLDLLNGRVKFLTAQGSNLTPVITCPAIVAGTAAAFFGLLAMQQPRRSGYGRLTCYDQDNANIVAFQHYNFSCDITLDTASEVDGTKWSDITIDVLVTTDIGTIYVRNDNADAGVAS